MMSDVVKIVKCFVRGTVMSADYAGLAALDFSRGFQPTEKIGYKPASGTDAMIQSSRRGIIMFGIRFQSSLRDRDRSLFYRGLKPTAKFRLPLSRRNRHAEDTKLTDLHMFIWENHLSPTSGLLTRRLVRGLRGGR